MTITARGVALVSVPLVGLAFMGGARAEAKACGSGCGEDAA